MRVIKLTHGTGNGVNTACLMTASNMLIGKGAEGDDNSCVCPLLREFIIKTNDAMPERLLGELYGPLIWEIQGTRTDDREVMQARAYAFADWAVREILPIMLRSRGKEEEAAKLEALKPITDRESAGAAGASAGAAGAAAGAAGAEAAPWAAGASAGAAGAAEAAMEEARAARWAAAAAAAAEAAGAAMEEARAARWAAAAAAAAEAAGAAMEEARAARWAAAAAAAAAEAAGAEAAEAAAEIIWRKCPEIIRRVAAIGDKRPVEVCMTEQELCEALR